MEICRVNPSFSIDFRRLACAVFINFANQPLYKRAVKANDGKAVPEARLPPIIIGAILLSDGLFWFEWTTASSYPWALPVIAAGKMT